MIFSKSMYYGPHAWERRAELLENLRERRWQPACYIVTAARKPNLYEIWNSVSFLNPRLDTEDVEVLGLAYGYQEALRLIQRMLREEGIQKC